MAVSTVTPTRDSEHVRLLLGLPEIRALIADLDNARWTGRVGYGNRALIGMCLVKAVYALPTWSRVVRLVADHAALRDVIGCAPTADACYRFARKLRENRVPLDVCLHRVVTRLAATTPGYGADLAIDGSDMPAYANGQRYVSRGGRLREKFSDSDASWGHRSSVSTRSGGGYYGFKLHAAVCTHTGLPVAWSVETAKEQETLSVDALLDSAAVRGVRPATIALDKGYDNNRVYATVAAHGARPVIPLRQTPDVKAGRHQPPTCEHGAWTFAGAEEARQTTKWRCPTGECTPGSVRLPASRLHPLIPRSTPRFRALYKGRGAVEREFGRLKNEWGLAPLRVRGLDRVRLHADLTILARLATALTTAPAIAAAA
ncbi:MAG: hypothetical protein QOD07_591 [Frankiaceae bacterium]|jgi:hypothetical protein|nr:hypothetical protein [Frankiaceae bacterium]